MDILNRIMKKVEELKPEFNIGGLNKSVKTGMNLFETQMKEMGERLNNPEMEELLSRAIETAKQKSNEYSSGLFKKEYFFSGFKSELQTKFSPDDINTAEEKAKTTINASKDEEHKRLEEEERKRKERESDE